MGLIYGTWGSVDHFSNSTEAIPQRMGIPGQHRLHTMPGDLGQVGIVNASSS